MAALSRLYIKLTHHPRLHGLMGDSGMAWEHSSSERSLIHGKKAVTVMAF
jgi:hypothetical protein